MKRIRRRLSQRTPGANLLLASEFFYCDETAGVAGHGPFACDCAGTARLIRGGERNFHSWKRKCALIAASLTWFRLFALGARRRTCRTITQTSGCADSEHTLIWTGSSSIQHEVSYTLF